MRSNSSDSSISQIFYSAGFLLVIFPLIVFAQTPHQGSRSESNTDLDSLAFEAKLNKNTYLPYEPIVAKFKLSNKTARELAIPPPEILLHTQLLITDPSGRERRVTSLSLSSGGGPNMPGAPLTIGPFQVFEAETILPLGPVIFEKPGNYSLRFSLNGLEANAVKISVIEPAGINKDAFEFLKRHGRDPHFGTVFSDRKGTDVLEKFVREYSNSVYGEYAVSALGRYYLYNGQPEKAKKEFEKIISSEIELLAKWSKKDLAEAEKKLAQKMGDQ